MKLYVNRRIRDKAMVLGLPAESFLIPWACGVYWLFRNMDRLKRNLHSGRQYPLHLKNR